MKHCVGINTKHVATCTKISAQPCKFRKHYGSVSLAMKRNARIIFFLFYLYYVA